ncbi:MAG: clostripain-related cysteine peptidase [Planctomycetes bacterium]|nr:clostripain-related cysteine peptidase [Planctomycetota bacterium]
MKPTLLALAAWIAGAASGPPPTGDPERPWTFLIYAAVDNNAEEDGNFFSFLDGVRGALADDAGIDVVLFIDRSEGYSTNARSLGEDFTDARLYHVRAAGCTRLAGGEAFPEITLDSTYEPNSADPSNVRKFVAFGKSRFPARHTALMLYGHADGRAMCPDEKSRREMGFAELTSVATEKEAVDLMALEMCNMAGVEIAYQWRPGNGGFSTKALVAIPNAGPPLAWSRVFARLRASGSQAENGPGPIDPAKLSGADFGRLIVEEGGAARLEAGEEREAVGCYDLTKVEAVKRAVDALAVELARSDARTVFEELRGPGPQGFVLNYGRNRLDRAPFVDLHDLCRRSAACERLDARTRSASEAVLAAVDELVLASWGGKALPAFEAGKSGIFIVFPDGAFEVRGRDGRTERVWARCRWYSPLEVPDVYGRLAWCSDGAKPGNGQVENWFELLDRWFDDTGEGPGGANGYAP